MPAPQEKKQEEEAATKIQAAFRGHKTRKSMKQPESKSATGEPEPTKQELEAEFRPDDQGMYYLYLKFSTSLFTSCKRVELITCC